MHFKLINKNKIKFNVCTLGLTLLITSKSFAVFHYDPHLDHKDVYNIEETIQTLHAAGLIRNQADADANRAQMQAQCIAKNLAYKRKAEKDNQQPRHRQHQEEKDALQPNPMPQAQHQPFQVQFPEQGQNPALFHAPNQAQPQVVKPEHMAPTQPELQRRQPHVLHAIPQVQVFRVPALPQQQPFQAHFFPNQAQHPPAPIDQPPFHPQELPRLVFQFPNQLAQHPPAVVDQHLAEELDIQIETQSLYTLLRNEGCDVPYRTLLNCIATPEYRTRLQQNTKQYDQWAHAQPRPATIRFFGNPYKAINASANEIQVYELIRGELTTLLDTNKLTPQEAAQPFQLLEILETFHVNNKEICQELFENNRTAPRNFPTIVLHPEESQLSLEERAPYFFNILSTAYQLLKTRNETEEKIDFFKNAFNLTPVCTEAKIEYMQGWYFKYLNSIQNHGTNDPSFP